MQKDSKLFVLFSFCTEATLNLFGELDTEFQQLLGVSV